MRRGPLLAFLVLGAIPLAAQEPTTRALSLDQALGLALAKSDAVEIAQADVLRARGEVKRVRADLLPQLTGVAYYTRTLKSQFSSGGGARDTTATQSCDRFSGDPTLAIDQRVDSLERSVHCLSALDPFAALGNLPFGRTNQYSLGLQFSQTLLSGALIKGRPRAAVAGRRIADLGLRSARAQATLDVTRAYYDATLANRLLAIAQATLDQADTTLAQIRLGRQVGTQPEFELLRAQVTRDNQRATAIQRRTDRDLAHLRLKQLLHLPLDLEVELSSTFEEGADSGAVALDSLELALADTTADERSPVRQAAEAEKLQDVLTGVTRAERWPTVTLTSKFAQLAYPSRGLPGTGDFLTDWNLAVTLSVPLWTSGRIGGDIMVAEASLIQARVRHRQARDFAAVESREAIRRLEAGLASWQATQGTVEQARRAYQIAEVRYREGISTQTELSDARILLQQAEANRAIAARDVAVARTRLRLLSDLPLTGVDVGQTLSNAQSGQQSLQQQQPAGSPAGSTGF